MEAALQNAAEQSLTTPRCTSAVKGTKSSQGWVESRLGAAAPAVTTPSHTSAVMVSLW